MSYYYFRTVSLIQCYCFIIYQSINYIVMQIEAALAVDAIKVIQLTLAQLISNSTNIFKQTFRRGEVYNYNITKGVPCETEPPVPWMHGVALMQGMKNVSTCSNLVPQK